MKNIAELKAETIRKKLKILQQAGTFESKETIHSELLAYFLLKNRDFLKKFLNKAGYDFENLSGISSTTEKYHIDVLIENEEFVLVIENKYKDRNRTNQNNTSKKEDDKYIKDQLTRYETLIKEKYSKTPIFVYLRPFMHQLANKEWKKITYKDILNIIETIETNEELEAYKKILKEIYYPQEICISALEEYISFKDKNIDDERDDINGYSIEIPLKHLYPEYNSYIQFEHFEPVEKRGKIKINLLVKASDKTNKDSELLEIVSKKLKNKLKTSKNGEYEWVHEFICRNCNFTEELVRRKIKNSKLIEILKQKV